MTIKKKSDKPYFPTKIEVVKTVIIAVLVTAVIFFVAGIQYESNQKTQIDKAVESAILENEPSKDSLSK